MVWGDPSGGGGVGLDPGRALAAGGRPRDLTEDWGMPADKDFKRLVRARMGKTGESYTTARAHLRPDRDPGPPERFQGRHPDTAGLTRLLAALGVTDPATGRPLSEAMVLGVAGGIGFAYFVFEYEQLTSLYLGGRINPFVHKRDPAEAALARLGVTFRVRRTSGPATAERQLRAALDQGRPVLATVDPARLPHRGVPPELEGMVPQDVLVEPGDSEPSSGTWPRRRSRSAGPSWPQPGPGSARPGTGWWWPTPAASASS